MRKNDVACVVAHPYIPGQHIGSELGVPRAAKSRRKKLYAGEGFSPLLVREASVTKDAVGTASELILRADDKAILYLGDCLSLLSQINEQYPDGFFDLIFADPPYFLSNGGITCKSGRMVLVDKGQWDRSSGPEEDHEFNRVWLAACRAALRPHGTIWVSGTSHVIYSVGYAMQQMGFKILNDITWEKPNPPPNLSCRRFTHSTETVLWAAKSSKSKYTFNYEEMRRQAGGKQMKSVWRITPPEPSEKRHGKHPTQKPVALLKRIIEASSSPGFWVLDPFMGSGTTGVAAVSLSRRFVGIDSDRTYVNLSAKRVEEALSPAQAGLFPKP